MIEYWKKNILNCWNVFSRNYIFLLTPYVLLLLIILYVSISINDVSMPLPKIVLLLALSLLSCGINIGAISITYKAIIGKKITFKNIFQKFDKLLLILITNIGLFGLSYMLLNIFPISESIVSVIITILYFMFLCFYDYIIIIENLSIREAIIKNYQLVSNNLLLVFQFIIILFLIGFCLSIFQLIGIIFALCFIRIVGINFYLSISKSIKID